MNIRKVVHHFEETRTEGGQTLAEPTRKVIAAAILLNPYAGRTADADDLEALIDAGETVGALLVERAVAALGVDPADVTGYGKGAVVGTAGTLEHAAAVIHPRFGKAVRAVVGPGKAIIASTKKVAGPGSALVIPLANKEDIWSVDDFDGAEIAVPDAPHDDEILVALALAVGGRPGHRITLA